MRRVGEGCLGKDWKMQGEMNHNRNLSKYHVRWKRV